MKNNTIRKIKKKPLKDKMLSIRLTPQQQELINASSIVNKVAKSKVIDDAVNKYFGIN